MSNRAVQITARNLHRHHGSFPNLLMGVRKYEQVSLQSTIKVPRGREITYELSWHLFEQLYDRKPYTDNYSKKEVGSWKRIPGSIEAYSPVFGGTEVTVGFGKTNENSHLVSFKAPAPTEKTVVYVVDKGFHDQLPSRLYTEELEVVIFKGTSSLCFETQTRRIVFSEEMFKVYYKSDLPTNSYTKRKKEEIEMNDLFSVIDGEHKGKFVTKLAQNSAGLQVVEVRGTGEIFAVPSEALEKVMPFTVNVRYMAGANTREYSFFAKADDVEIGDVIFSPNYTSAMQVVGVNTKSASATTWLDGSVIKADKVLTKPKED